MKNEKWDEKLICSHTNVTYLVYSSGHIWHPVVPQWSVRVYSWSFAGNMRPGSNPSRHSSGSPNCRWEHMGGFPLSQGFMDLFGLDWTFTCLKQLLLEEWCFDALKNWLCFEFSHLASWANSKQTQVLSTLKPMRTLELVQPFFTSFEFWDFFIFPPSYVVSKLSYSQRALGSKWGQ